MVATFLTKNPVWYTSIIKGAYGMETPGGDPHGEAFRSRVQHSGPEAGDPTVNSRVQSTMDRPGLRINISDGSPRPAADEVAAYGDAEATVETDPALEVLNSDRYMVSEIDGRVVAHAGNTEADVTAMFAPGRTIDRYKPTDPTVPDSPLAVTESVVITQLTRSQSGTQAGMLRIAGQRPGIEGAKGRVTIDLADIGILDAERRTWRLPTSQAA